MAVGPRKACYGLPSSVCYTAAAAGRRHPTLSGWRRCRVIASGSSAVPAQDGEIKMSETSKQPGTYQSAADTLRMVRERNAETDPLDRLLQLQRELVALESRHGLASAEMFRRFQAGELGDDAEIVAWVGRYRLFLELREIVPAS